MIKRTLTIKVQGNRCVCDAPLYLHTQDKNIHVVINVTNTKFEIKDDMLLSFTIIKPNGDEVNKSDCYIDKGQCHLLFNGEDFDEETEVGTHLVQLKLYDKDRQARLSLPPFAMHVLKSSGSFYADEEMEGLLAEQNAYKLMTENKLALKMSVSILISDLPTTIKVEGYAPVTQGDTTYKLDMTNVASKTYVATEIAKAQLSGEEIDLSVYATKEDLTNELTNKANKEHTHAVADVDGLQGELDGKAIINHTHNYNELTDTPTIPSLDGYATETFVTEKIAEASLGGEIDLSAYATKDEVNSSLATKSDVGHTHEQYLTEHQDLSDYALKTELPTVPTKVSELTNDSGFITTIPNEYVTETELDAKGYLTEHQDVSNLATKEELTNELATKSDTTHNHDDMYSKLDHTHTGMLTSTTITRIELVDALPSDQEENVLYIVRGE